MTTLEADPTVIKTRNAVPTRTAGRETLGRFPPTNQADKDAWQVWIDVLAHWELDPDALLEEGLTPPSRAILQAASFFAVALRDNGHAPPLRVVPSGEGGVVFERRGADGVFERMEVRAARLKSLDLSIPDSTLGGFIPWMT